MNNSTLKVTLVQTDIYWEKLEENRIHFEQKIDSIREQTDMILLPELFSTGFSMNANHLAETMEGPTVQWMLKKAEQKNAVVIGSVLIKENEKCYNRLVVAFPNGKTIFYDKRHLFSYAGEHTVFEAGRKRITFEYKGFKIFPLICYDLRFPVWARNDSDYDILLFVANWPNARINAWDTLLKARSIENLCYTIGLNRVGVDDNDLIYTGHSAVYDAFGATLLSFEENVEGIKSVTLEKEHLITTRKRFSFLEDRDEFHLNLN
ncbi:amidohydrolase [Namhaeicola litoreus]|uniref:Amidohydrolase n=1 Tax=Namhaeicola litoreus TaxID=1052145 RepID=A0ABW3Y0Q9_9FLAO